MTDQKNKLAQVFAACWKDEALKARFLADPKAVLAEPGIEAPAHIDVKVVENSHDTVHITLPQAPQGDDLSDDELSAAAGSLVAIPTFTPACEPTSSVNIKCRSLTPGTHLPRPRGVDGEPRGGVERSCPTRRVGGAPYRAHSGRRPAWRVESGRIDPSEVRRDVL